MINELIKVRQPYSVNAISQIVARLAFENRAAFERGIDSIIDERERVFSALSILPDVKVYPSDSNFILFKTERADEFWNYLLDQGVQIRNLSKTPGLEGCLRVSIGLPEQNDLFLDLARSFILAKGVDER